MKLKLILGILFFQLVTFSACYNDMSEPKGDSLQMLIGRVSNTNVEEYSSELSYTLCLFQAPASAGGKLEDDDFTCTLIEKGLTEAELKDFSFKVPHEEKEMYAYRLFVHATPVKSETAILLSEGDIFSKLEICLINEADGSYVPLSKDNYYDNYTVNPQDFSGVITIPVTFKRFVGRMVFDIFKSDSNLNPIDIESGYGSTLDRVTEINVQVKGITTGIKPSKEGFVVTKDENETTFLTLLTMLDGNFHLNVAEQDQDYFSPVLGKKEEGVVTMGGVRLYSVFLLPTGKEKDMLKANLTFKYKDQLAGNAIPDEESISLNLPSGKSGYLRVAENCYTLTNIRLKNNRIIDIDVSGGIEIETGWD